MSLSSTLNLLPAISILAQALAEDTIFIVIQPV